MPVLETPEIIYRESRVDALLAIRRLLDKHADHVLAVRIGATDLCGLFGLRRDRDLTIYDLSVVRECIGDIVNVCGRDGSHVITGPVWEYFSSPERLWVSPLRVTPVRAGARGAAAARAGLDRPRPAHPRGGAGQGERPARQDGDPPEPRRGGARAARGHARGVRRRLHRARRATPAASGAATTATR